MVRVFYTGMRDRAGGSTALALTQFARLQGGTFVQEPAGQQTPVAGCSVAFEAQECKISQLWQLLLHPAT